MNNQKVDEVLRGYKKLLEDHGYTAKRFPTGQKLPYRGSQPALEHLIWMCNEALTFPAERLEKKCRWLGFVQGVLWRENLSTIEEAKKKNMPEGEEYKA
jgi:hypothetical protein